jgi:hypothetical protein
VIAETFQQYLPKSLRANEGPAVRAGRRSRPADQAEAVRPGRCPAGAAGAETSRFTFTTYNISRQTGKVIWQLGGKRSTFRLKAAHGQKLNSAGAIFAYQHDPEALGHGLYTLFDNEAGPSTALLAQSRAVMIRIGRADRTATLIRSYDQPAGLLSRAQGNAQTTRDGDLFVGWGRCRSSRSSARPAGLCSTPGCRSTSVLTGPTDCPGIRPAASDRRESRLQLAAA